MSTIASPRDTSVNGRRVPLISTPTTSSRPSLEGHRSADASPNRGPLSNQTQTQVQPKRNRAALREYYNIKKALPSPSLTDSTAIDDQASEASSIHDFSSVDESELDRSDFNAPSYIKHVLETQSLSELMRTYNSVLTDIRALDAEKKALVYDNYSKLIKATETIRKMRVNMDPLNPMAKTLDPAIRSVWERAEVIREEMKELLGEGGKREAEMGREEKERERKRRKGREVVRRVLDTPERVRGLVAEGKTEEAERLWSESLRLLERWKERGVGGEDVQNCIDDGEAALKGEPPNEKSWVNVKITKS